MPATYGSSQAQNADESSALRTWLIAKPAAQEEDLFTYTRSRAGTGYELPYHPNTLIDMRPAGIEEVWAFGWRQRILRYDMTMELRQVINTYNTPRPNNNYIFPWDAWIDFSSGILFCPCWSYNVVRAFDLATLISGGYTRGVNGSGGHLYDVGLPNGTNNWFRADKGSSSRNGEGGALHNAVSCTTKDGKLYVASYQGFANASQTSNLGFIVRYDFDASGAANPTIIAAYNGTYPEGLSNVNFRYPYGKLRFQPGTDKLIVASNWGGNGGYGYYEIDASNPAGSPLIEQRVQPTDPDLETDWRPYGLNFDSSGNRLWTERSGDARGVIETDQSQQVIHHAGESKASSSGGLSYYLFDFPMDCIKIENGEGSRDWYVVCDYAQHTISMLPVPDGDNQELGPFVEAAYEFSETDGTEDEYPDGDWLIQSVSPEIEFSVGSSTGGIARLPLSAITRKSINILMRRAG